jgi:hypothetical protein
MPNLNKLKILLNLQEYKENAKLKLTKKATGAPDGIEFENAGETSATHIALWQQRL